MIGKSVSNAVLDGWTGAFYQWDGEVKVGCCSRHTPALPGACEAWAGSAATHPPCLRPARLGQGGADVG
jgi:hypothetical protein